MLENDDGLSIGDRYVADGGVSACELERESDIRCFFVNNRNLRNIARLSSVESSGDDSVKLLIRGLLAALARFCCWRILQNGWFFILNDVAARQVSTWPPVWPRVGFWYVRCIYRGCCCRQIIFRCKRIYWTQWGSCQAMHEGLL
ncbi:uncharacterized protein LOC124461943 [Drosophila willistoni]|uniref:uncharacterized protein LOC124461090 n=1 Tax=Drosophila willistoni TaxID=7260 RepID=UPI001F07F834|nr:uncharacterized protein LOC124461090 [Drosophila willistoni]XP_046869298.1 uncharacterized protein LOC124461943 [Drosophila willistoni]